MAYDGIPPDFPPPIGEQCGTEDLSLTKARATVTKQERKLGEGESAFVAEIAMAGIRTMAERAARAGTFTAATMVEAAMHVLAAWIAVESDHMDMDANVAHFSKQLRSITKSHLNDLFVQNLKTSFRPRGAR